MIFIKNISMFRAVTRTIGGLMLLVLMLSPGVAQVTAFKQAVAEGAASHDQIAQFYRENNYEAIWTDADSLDRRRALANALRFAGDHGLPVRRYAVSDLRKIFSNIVSERQRGFAEIEATKLFLRYARDLQTGILEPETVDEGIVRRLPRRAVAAQLAQLRDSNPYAFMRSLIPASPAYTRLLKAKMDLEAILTQGGWGPQIRATSLRPGETGAAVVEMRNRLIKMGYLEARATATYDSVLERAVYQFQNDHGLEADGVAGAATIRQINIDPLTRLQSVIVGLERERWINFENGLGQRHVMVNIVDFHAQIVDHGKVTFETVAVVGRARVDKQTPEFSDEMEHMVINPTWHVPRSIATKEYLPNMQSDPNANAYLELYDDAGQQVSRSSVNFNAYNARNFPYNMRQPPSDQNALGLVKFMFPNRWNIYLHDSPAKTLFDTEVRTHSSGCIRLARPFEFGYEILSAQEPDPKTFFQSVLSTGTETQVNIEDHVPVHITYKTVFAPARGRLQFRADVYGRDGRLWSALQNLGVSVRALQS